MIVVEIATSTNGAPQVCIGDLDCGARTGIATQSDYPG